jgi:hypothetical protein
VINQSPLCVTVHLYFRSRLLIKAVLCCLPYAVAGTSCRDELAQNANGLYKTVMTEVTARLLTHPTMFKATGKIRGIRGTPEDFTYSPKKVSC